MLIFIFKKCHILRFQRYKVTVNEIIKSLNCITNYIGKNVPRSSQCKFIIKIK